MRYPLTILLACLSITVCGQQLERHVIASAGDQGSTHSFTIGEVVVTSDNLQVTAGFQQPTFMVNVTLGMKDITSELNVYPVPAKNIVTIKGATLQGLSTQIQLFNLDGKEVLVSTERFQNEMHLDLSQLPSGNYYLTLRDATNQTSAKLKIVKIK